MFQCPIMKILERMEHRCWPTVILTPGTLWPLVWLGFQQLYRVDYFVVIIRWFWSACSSSVLKWTPAPHLMLHIWQKVLVHGTLQSVRSMHHCQYTMLWSFISPSRRMTEHPSYLQDMDSTGCPWRHQRQHGAMGFMSSMSSMQLAQMDDRVDLALICDNLNVTPVKIQTSPTFEALMVNLIISCERFLPANN